MKLILVEVLYNANYYAGGVMLNFIKIYLKFGMATTSSIITYLFATARSPFASTFSKGGSDHPRRNIHCN